jgi:hypothetical protein
VTKEKSRERKFVVGFRPEVRAREGRMLGIRQPLDGPVFDILEDAENWCMYAMIDHFDRKLGMADAKIHPFKGMLDFGPPPDPVRVRETQRVVAEVDEERRRNGKPPPSFRWRVKAVSESLGEVFILRPLF